MRVEKIGHTSGSADTAAETSDRGVRSSSGSTQSEDRHKLRVVHQMNDYCAEIRYSTVRCNSRSLKSVRASARKSRPPFGKAWPTDTSTTSTAPGTTR